MAKKKFVFRDFRAALLWIFLFSFTYCNAARRISENTGVQVEKIVKLEKSIIDELSKMADRFNSKNFFEEVNTIRELLQTFNESQIAAFEQLQNISTWTQSDVKDHANKVEVNIEEVKEYGKKIDETLQLQQGHTEQMTSLSEMQKMNNQEQVDKITGVEEKLEQFSANVAKKIEILTNTLMTFVEKQNENVPEEGSCDKAITQLVSLEDRINRMEEHFENILSEKINELESRLNQTEPPTTAPPSIVTPPPVVYQPDDCLTDALVNDTNRLVSELYEEQLSQKKLLEASIERQNVIPTPQTCPAPVTVEPFLDRISRLTLEAEKMKKNLTNAYNLFRPKDCSELLMSGYRESGVYRIYPYSCFCNQSIPVWCDQVTDGGGWTHIIRRYKNYKTMNFTRSWNDYKRGFGTVQKEYWIGNDLLHYMTKDRKLTLRIEAKDKYGRTRWGKWKVFNVASEKKKYTLTVKGFDPSSTLGNSMAIHNGQRFSTFDRDNDFAYRKSCAHMHQGGWWFRRCYDIHPTSNIDKLQGIKIRHFTPGDKNLVNLNKLVLMIRPSVCDLNKKFRKKKI